MKASMTGAIRVLVLGGMVTSCASAKENVDDLAGSSADVSEALTTVCPSGDWDMLDWMTLDSWRTHHVVNAVDPSYGLPKYSYVGATHLYQMKGVWKSSTGASFGYPWDVLTVDATATGHIWQWITEGDWSGATPWDWKQSVATTSGRVWLPRCLPATTQTAKVLWSYVNADVSYDQYDCGSTCCTKPSFTGGSGYHGVNELLGTYTGRVKMNGAYVTSIELHDRYGCKPGDLRATDPDVVYDASGKRSCRHMEVFHYAKAYGWVKWELYQGQSSTNTWIHPNGSKDIKIFDTVKANGDYDQNGTTGDTLQPVHPCF